MLLCNLQFFPAYPKRCIVKCGKNTNKACVGNPASYERKRSSLYCGHAPNMGTTLFWNENNRSLHLSQTSQLGRLKFQIHCGRRRSNRHIRKCANHLYSFHKILPCTFRDGKTSRLYYERTCKRHQGCKISFSLCLYFDTIRCGKFPIFDVYLLSRHGTWDIASNCD